MHTVSIGIDLHKQQFTCYFLKGRTGKFFEFTSDKTGINQFKRRLKQLTESGFKVKMAVESTGNTKYFKKELERDGYTVLIVNTLKFKVVNESVNKTDKRDARTIAEFLEKDMLPLVQLSSDVSEKLKKLVTARRLLVVTNVKLKNQLIGMLLGLGITVRSGSLNSKKGRLRILTLIEDLEYRMIAETTIETIELIFERIKKIEKKLEDQTVTDRTVEVLKSIPGTGLITAVTVRAYIDDIKRFDNYNRLSSYCGLVPRVRCSDTTEYYGKITKRGPVELRTALIQMVLGMIRFRGSVGNRLMLKYGQLKKIKGSGKALVAIARKFTRIIWVLLTRNELFDITKQMKSSDLVSELI